MKTRYLLTCNMKSSDVAPRMRNYTVMTNNGPEPGELGLSVNVLLFMSHMMKCAQLQNKLEAKAGASRSYTHQYKITNNNNNINNYNKRKLIGHCLL